MRNCELRASKLFSRASETWVTFFLPGTYPISMYNFEAEAHWSVAGELQDLTGGWKECSLGRSPNIETLGPSFLWVRANVRQSCKTLVIRWYIDGCATVYDICSWLYNILCNTVFCLSTKHLSIHRAWGPLLAGIHAYPLDPLGWRRSGRWWRRWITWRRPTPF